MQTWRSEQGTIVLLVNLSRPAILHWVACECISSSYRTVHSQALLNRMVQSFFRSQQSVYHIRCRPRCKFLMLVFAIRRNSTALCYARILFPKNDVPE